MTPPNFRYILLATIFVVFLNLTNQVAGATLERRLAKGELQPLCDPDGTLVTPNDCDVAVLTLPFTNKRSILSTQTTVVSVFRSCKVYVFCDQKAQTTSMALMSNNLQNGGYTRLLNECGHQKKSGVIFFDTKCSIRTTSA
ncbi:hypothetical protein PGT21_035206 [Puccinia graminis f. sp. tritici]|uniref:Uncharacterized protein n=2 Tax=Puccinia graminis f. sp. tritici TaxID=56615 RepID=A0A5B0S9D8_PUCGR|nr:hypothetical protein PGT21_035206 [Puccinia graminis f. sp. tritici]KAA1121330.1 hypothetical protein PGTUg99_009549 [Puccinia graminis f. sp. tritici]KAA1134417.1 hypothetical protein PGTUg99_001591 [Puccinia graminis f. sp. tritici]